MAYQKLINISIKYLNWNRFFHKIIQYLHTKLSWLYNKNIILNNSKTFSVFNFSWENKSHWCIPLSFKFFKRISKAIFQKSQIIHIMHMNNISQKSSFIYKNYLTKVICILYFACCKWNLKYCSNMRVWPKLQNAKLN